MKPFTTIGGLLFGIVALVQAGRAVTGIDVAIDGYHVPVFASWIAAGVTGLLSVMLLSEARR